jgi:hypothetical protein
MKIFSAIGFGIALVILRLFMPEVFRAFEDLLLEFLRFLKSILSGQASLQFALPADLIPRVE